jgi:iron complex transport system ATP-binding protein
MWSSVRSRRPKFGWQAMPSVDTALETRGLDVSIGERRLVHDLSIALPPKGVIALLGPNGVGKTLLMHTLAALRPIQQGDIRMAGESLAHWPRRRLAKHLAMMPQTVEDPFPATVLETVLLGRHPHIDAWRWESTADIAIAKAALLAVGLAGYEGRDVLTLSGGERRRASLAAALAQEPKIFLLDEPTNHLDPAHQLDALRLLRERADAGALVILTMHDPTLAARYADHVLLLYSAGHWRFGAAAEVLNAANLSELYSSEIRLLRHEGRSVFFHA